MMSLFKLRGFTLIELLIVMVIIGLTSSLVVPSMMRQVESAREIGEYEKLKNIIGLIKVKSFFSGKVIHFEFNDQQLIIKELGESNTSVTSREFYFEYIKAETHIIEIFNADNSISPMTINLITLRGKELSLDI